MIEVILDLVLDKRDAGVNREFANSARPEFKFIKHAEEVIESFVEALKWMGPCHGLLCNVTGSVLFFIEATTSLASTLANENALTGKLLTEVIDIVLSHSFGPRFSDYVDIRCYNLRETFVPWPKPKGCEHSKKECPDPGNCPAKVNVSWSKRRLSFMHTHASYRGET